MKSYNPARAVTNESGYTIGGSGVLSTVFSAPYRRPSSDRDWVWKDAPSDTEWSSRCCRLGDLLSDAKLPHMQFLASVIFGSGVSLTNPITARWAKGGWHEIQVDDLVYREHGKKLYRKRAVK